MPLVERAHGWWFGFVPGMGPGQRYNVRVAGEWSPDTGQRHNAAKLLLDPYARAVEGEVTWGPEVYGHVVDDAWHGDGELRSDLDSRGAGGRSRSSASPLFQVALGCTPSRRARFGLGFLFAAPWLAIGMGWMWQLTARATSPPVRVRG